MKFVIQGGKKLSGEIVVSGAKNAATPIIAATALTRDECVIDNVPRITDVEAMLDILRSVGGRAEWTGDNQVTICNADLDLATLDKRLVKKLRSSILFAGSFLGRSAQVTLSEPGGCNIGNRPLDTHFHGLQKLGVTIAREGDEYRMVRTTLEGAEIVLLEASVTGTENILMAASLARGVTVIKNAACEPHVQDLADFLVAMGAKIEGIGTPTLRVEGVEVLHSAHHRIIPDTIEAGTFIVLGVASRSPITVRGVAPRHMEVVLELLYAMGAQLEVGVDYVRVIPSDALRAHKITTQLYPGIPTDLQQIFGVLATQCEGLSLIHDTLYEGRMSYIQELVRMGAKAIVCDPHRVVVHGSTPLYGCAIKSYDLRAGASMLIAGLIAQGETVIHEAEIVDRGYEAIEARLHGLGADIVRMS